jgi:hypothetical protein
MTTIANKLGVAVAGCAIAAAASLTSVAPAQAAPTVPAPAAPAVLGSGGAAEFPWFGWGSKGSADMLGKFRVSPLKWFNFNIVHFGCYGGHGW